MSQSIAKRVINEFDAELQKFKTEHADLIHQLSKIVDEKKHDELFWSSVEDLKSTLGSNASNRVSNESASDRVISEVEELFADLYSNNEGTVEIILFNHGVEKGALLIRNALLKKYRSEVTIKYFWRCESFPEGLPKKITGALDETAVITVTKALTKDVLCTGGDLIDHVNTKVDGTKTPSKGFVCTGKFKIKRP